MHEYVRWSRDKKNSTYKHNFVNHPFVPLLVTNRHEQRHQQSHPGEEKEFHSFWSYKPNHILRCPSCLLTSLRRLFRGSKNLLLLQQLRKLAGLVHGDKDIATTDKLLVHIQLGDRGPVGVFLDAYHSTKLIPNHYWRERRGREGQTLSDFIVLQHIDCRKLCWVDALQPEDLHRCTRESALRHLRGTLHEQDYRGSL